MMNSASSPISIQKSLPYTPNIAARIAFTTCVAGSHGLIFWMNEGSICNGNDPPQPVTWTISSSTATALPRFANAATSA